MESINLESSVVQKAPRSINTIHRFGMSSILVNSPVIT
jgi:hypothetical protein